MAKNPEKIHQLQNDLHEIANEQAYLYTQELELVRKLRAAGASWTEVGKPLLISKQAAQQNFGHRLAVSEPLFKEPEL